MPDLDTQIRARKAQPTLYDVSRLSGVSSATVSRVFSGRARVSDEVKKRVIEGTASSSHAKAMSERVQPLADKAWEFALKAGIDS